MDEGWHQLNLEMMFASQDSGGLSTILTARGGGCKRREAEVPTHLSHSWWLPCHLDGGLQCSPGCSLRPNCPRMFHLIHFHRVCNWPLVQNAMGCGNMVSLKKNLSKMTISVE